MFKRIHLLSFLARPSDHGIVYDAFSTGLTELSPAKNTREGKLCDCDEKAETTKDLLILTSFPSSTSLACLSLDRFDELVEGFALST